MSLQQLGTYEVFEELNTSLDTLASQPMMHATTDCGAFVMDIVVWLRSLGLGKYEAVFRENDIDKTVLPNLTAEDLKELGVTFAGPPP